MSSENRVVRLQRSFWYYRTDAGLELGSVIKGVRLRLRVESGCLERLLSALEDGVPVETAVEALTEASGLSEPTVRRLVRELTERGVLLEGPRVDPYRDTRYDRQVRFFDMFESSVATGSDLNRRLQERKVLIVGLGGFGTWLTLLCSRTGIRHIVGIDPDIVELSNLSRQVLYSPADVGDLKINACARSLRQVDPEINFQGFPVWIKRPGDLRPYLDGVDLVFNAFGYIPNPGLVSVATDTLRAGIPSLLLGGSWIGPLTMPGQTACYWCLMSRRDLEDVVNASMGRFVVQESVRPIGVFAPRIAVTTSVAVWEAARFLSGIDRSPALDGLLALDLFRHAHAAFAPLARNEHCSACGASPRD